MPSHPPLPAPSQDDGGDESGYSQEVSSAFIEMLFLQEPPAIPSQLLSDGRYDRDGISHSTLGHVARRVPSPPPPPPPSDEEMQFAFLGPAEEACDGDGDRRTVGSVGCVEEEVTPMVSSYLGGYLGEEGTTMRSDRLGAVAGRLRAETHSMLDAALLAPAARPVHASASPLPVCSHACTPRPVHASVSPLPVCSHAAYTPRLASPRLPRPCRCACTRVNRYPPLPGLTRDTRPRRVSQAPTVARLTVRCRDKLVSVEYVRPANEPR